MMKKTIKKILKPVYYPLKRIVKNIVYICKYDFEQVEEDRLYRYADKIIEDCVYEYEEDKKILKQLNILDENESINLILEKPKSFCRFGDGEIKIIQGIDQAFQKYDPILAKRLVEILESERDDIYVALNRAYFHTPIECSPNNRRFYRLHSTEYRRFFLKYCSDKKDYLDAGFLTSYFRFTDDYNFEEHYIKMENLFKDKKIALVCGNGIDKKFQYDVFHLAKEKMIINAPNINAFEKYDEILEKIKEKVPKDYLVCIILGMTAKVLAYDLTDLGYMAWDVGHIAKDYDAYKNNIEKTTDNAISFWNPD